MSKKSKKENNDELWSKKFDGEVEESTNENTNGGRKRQSRISPILTGSVALLALLIVVIIFFYVFYRGRDEAKVEDTSDQVTLQENSSDIKNLNLKKRDKEQEEQEEKAKKEQEQKEQEQKEQERKKQLEEQKRKQQEEQAKLEEKQKQQEEQQNQSSRTQESQQQPTNTNSQTYTVQAGDNLYRIAVNHGMTLDELLQKNGLTADSPITPGDTLQVN